MSGVLPILGPYALQSRIGTGGMSELYLARRVADGEYGDTCVVKRLLPELVADRAMVTLFLDEARINLLLEHRNIVAVFDVGRDGDDVYLAMDHVDGVDLRWLLTACGRTGRRIPTPIALYVAAELLRALQHAHRARDLDGRPLRLVHRDVSPENVLLGHDGSVRLTDFGAARATVSRSHLEPGTTLGKLGYMAPEQLDRRQATPASDLFAVGLLLFEMLAMRALQRAESAQAAFEFWNRFEPTRVIPGMVPLGDGGAVLVKALERDPVRRYRTARAFREELDELRLRRGERPAAPDLADLLATLAGVDGAGEQVSTSPVDLGGLPRRPASAWGETSGQMLVLAGDGVEGPFAEDVARDRVSRADAPAALVARMGEAWRPGWELWPEVNRGERAAIPWERGEVMSSLWTLGARPGGWRVLVWLERTALEIQIADGRVVRTAAYCSGEDAAQEGRGRRDPELLGPAHEIVLARRRTGRVVARALAWDHMWALVLPDPGALGRRRADSPLLVDVISDAERSETGGARSR